MIAIKDYKGCRNCKNQIEPLRMCDWAEHGGMSNKVYIVCPRWEKKENDKTKDN